jgi:hypothetical protein
MKLIIMGKKKRKNKTIIINKEKLLKWHSFNYSKVQKNNL